jgi:photosystem II stability/assembly factor-like uncharacterized protein
MKRFYLILSAIISCVHLFAQQNNNSVISSNPGNIYYIRQQYLQNVLHNPNDKNMDGADNDLAKFNRWFQFVEPRCYPSGNLPRADVLISEYQKMPHAVTLAQRTTGAAPLWRSLGPANIPTDVSGLSPWVSVGRINCVVIDPLDTNTIYAGAACGGVWISHNCGATWSTHTDNLPSLSISDIAVNPKHPDTLYAATGDNAGREWLDNGTIFWGGLYAAGVMKSTDGGNTWNTTGFTDLQSNRQVISQVIIHPDNTNVLLAVGRDGIYRTADAGASWTLVDAIPSYNLAFHPLHPDTVYEASYSGLRVSYDAGITWQNLNITVGGWISVSPAAPNSVWIYNAYASFLVSNDEGHTFSALLSPHSVTNASAYCHGLVVSPADPNTIMACGAAIAKTADGAVTWTLLDTTNVQTHGDHHGLAFNPVNPATMYLGNDGGMYTTHDAGLHWTNISTGLTISQIYRMSSSRQDSTSMICGLQDNGFLARNSAGWHSVYVTGGDGMSCHMFPGNDSFQAVSSQNGCCFAMSYDQGNTFKFTVSYAFSSGYGNLTSPLLFNPRSADTLYYGLMDLWASCDRGLTFAKLTIDSPFYPNGAVAMAIAPSATHVMYAAGFNKILRTTDFGATWVDVTGPLPLDSSGITHIAVDYKNPMRIYITTSGYATGVKAFMSTTGGTTWTNISHSLPNIPANCIAVDSTTPGALYVGTDLGVFYMDSTMTDWAPYGTGFPNVVVDDMDINYAFHKIRVATYGRGAWECSLKNKVPNGIQIVNGPVADIIQVNPNPAKDYWKVRFSGQSPAQYTVRLTDENGRTLSTLYNSSIVSASKLANGIYYIEVTVGEQHQTLKAIKE